MRTFILCGCRQEQNPTTILSIILEENDLKIFPNPTGGSVRIELPEKLVSSLKFYDVSGKLVLEKELNALTDEIELNNLSTGVYHIKFTFTNGSISRQLIIE